MADGLLQALQALQTTPGETGWGMATTGLAAGLPNMINPYGDRGTNIGVALGGALLTALGAYQARQAAAEQSLEANKLWLGLQGLGSQERLAGIERADNPLIQGKLLDVNTQLEAAALAQQLERNKKIAELEAAAKFELGPIGQELEQNKLKRAVTLAGIQAGQIPSEYKDLFAVPAPTNIDALNIDDTSKELLKSLPPKMQQQAISELVKQKAGQEGSQGAQQQKNAYETVKDLERTFRNLDMTAAEFKAASAVPGTEAELAWSKLKGSLAALARVSGQTSQLSNVDLEQQLNSIIGPQAPVIGMLSGTESIADRIKAKLDMAKQPSSVTAPDEKLQILRQLQAELAAEKAKRGIK